MIGPAGGCFLKGIFKENFLINIYFKFKLISPCHREFYIFIRRILNYNNIRLKKRLKILY